MQGSDLSREDFAIRGLMNMQILEVTGSQPTIPLYYNQAQVVPNSVTTLHRLHSLNLLVSLRVRLSTIFLPLLGLK